jgi:hypothetical protein
MTTKPAPAAVIANLEVLTNKLRDIFEANAEHANAMQKRFVDALMAIANFLKRSGVEEDIAHKLAELAAAVSDLRWGTVADFLRPAVVGGRGPDGRAVWTCRTYVVIGFECILRSQKMKKQEAADYIEGKYPIFNRLVRNPGASLPKSIQSWRRNIISGRKADVIDVRTLHKFFEPHDLPSDEMFARGERALAKAAEETARAAL